MPLKLLSYYILKQTNIQWLDATCAAWSYINQLRFFLLKEHFHIIRLLCSIHISQQKFPSQTSSSRVDKYIRLLLAYPFFHHWFIIIFFESCMCSNIPGILLLMEKLFHLASEYNHRRNTGNAINEGCKLHCILTLVEFRGR